MSLSVSVTLKTKSETFLPNLSVNISGVTFLSSTLSSIVSWRIPATITSSVALTPAKIIPAVNGWIIYGIRFPLRFWSW